MLTAEKVKARALELGFDVVGVARAGRAPGAEAFLNWLEKGYYADMAWIAKNPERRSDIRNVVEGARSVVSVGLSYFVTDPPTDVWNDPLRGRIARYAWGRDYHDDMTPRLRELAAWIESESGRPVSNRAYVDTGPVLEGEWAVQAGLGFQGKHTLMISPEWGSYLFLGEILLDLELEPDPVGGESRGTCGSCRRCQDACPTHAFPAPYILDSRLCISYLTIEHRGAIPEALRTKMRNWIYGCDECQMACPWVKQFSKPGNMRFLKYDVNWVAPSLVELLQLDDQAFRDRFRKSPIPRTKRRGFLRNVCIALGNSRQPDVAIPALEKVLTDPEPLIREHAEWAIQRLRAE